MKVKSLLILPLALLASCSTSSRISSSHGHSIHAAPLAHMSPESILVSPKPGRVIRVKTTAYSHQENEMGGKYGRKTAIGTTLKYGKVRSAAADWSRFPLGTKFKIKGDSSLYVVDDYGSALVGTNTIDIYKPTLKSMRSWGAPIVDIQIVEWGCYQSSLHVLGPRTKYSQCRAMANEIVRLGKRS